MKMRSFGVLFVERSITEAVSIALGGVDLFGAEQATTGQSYDFATGFWDWGKELSGM